MSPTFALPTLVLLAMVVLMEPQYSLAKSSFLVDPVVLMGQAKNAQLDKVAIFQSAGNNTGNSHTTRCDGGYEKCPGSTICCYYIADCCGDFCCNSDETCFENRCVCKHDLCRGECCSDDAPTCCGNKCCDSEDCLTINGVLSKVCMSGSPGEIY